MMRAIRTAIASTLLALAHGTAFAAAPPAASVSGEVVYGRWCVHCHAGGRGNPGTQSLQIKYGTQLPAVLLERTDLTAPLITQFVRQGVLSMPPFRKTEITDAELAALATWMASGGGKR
jgi:(+)-pinoresinol hydroxylase